MDGKKGNANFLLSVKVDTVIWDDKSHGIQSTGWGLEFRFCHR